MTARQDPSFAQSLTSAGIVTVDGAGLAIAMRLLYPDVDSERYTGVMLTPDMVQLSAETGAGLFLLGAGPGIADCAAEVMLSDEPQGRIVGTWADGSPRPADDAESIRRIRESGAGILLVAYGAPAQIHWIERNLSALQEVGVRVVAGVGGAFDYISGNVALPSPLIRKLGLEWLVRLLREPWRWRRQLVLPHFAALVLIEVTKSRLRGGVE
jgi:N-acetylglucosaminyldiphosphoundecaprenol N-acetyl-beta-D-mannosaminyltransferase